MIHLIHIDESNWMTAAKLCVAPEQRRFVADAIGIIARGYVYRDCHACVWGIARDHTLVGLALVRGLDEEPACYDLQQLMIDARYQNCGYGSQALSLILERLSEERAYGCVEVCVKKDNIAALHIYEKAGFVDAGYVDERAMGSVNLMLYFD